MPKIKATVRWLPEALADVERLHAFLHDKNPAAASRAASVIFKGAQFLESLPQAGRPMDDDTGRREWFVAFGDGAYVLRYKLEDKKTVAIIRVWHSREFRA